MPRSFKSLSFVLLFCVTATVGHAATFSDDVAEGYTEPGFDWLMHEDLFAVPLTNLKVGEPGALALVAKAMREGDPRAGLALQNYLERYPRDPAAFDLAGTQLLREGKVNEAAIALERALKLNSNSSLTRAKLGAALAMKGELRAAGQMLRDAVVQDPGNALALHWLQRVAVTQGDMAAATRYAERALNAFGLPETTVNRAHIDLADFYIAAERWGDVLDLLSPVLRVETLRVPDNLAAEVYGRIAQAGTEVGDPDVASAALEKVRVLLPPTAFRNLPWPLLEARVLRMSGQPKEALAKLETLVGNDAKARRALADELARAKSAAGQTDEALSDLLEIIRTEPENETAQMAALYSDLAAQAGWPNGAADDLLAVMSADIGPDVALETARVELRSGKTDAARATIMAVIASEGTSAKTRVDAHVLLAGSAFSGGDAAQARQEIRKALELAPQNETLWLTLAAYTHDPRSHTHAGDVSEHEDLRAVMVEASDAIPESAAIWAELGIIDFTEGNTGSAAEMFLRSLKLSPARPQINVLAALALADSGGDLTLARSLADFAYKAQPNRAEVLDALGWVMAKQGDDLEKALEHIEAAARLEPNDPTILRHRAQLYQDTGRAGEAADTALRALAGELAKHDQEAARQTLLETRPTDAVELELHSLNADGSQGASVGTATLEDDEGRLLVRLDLKGLPPGSNELHIHELPNCGPDATGAPGASAGPHYGTGAMHTMDRGNLSDTDTENMAEMMKPRGDLPAVEADAEGKATMTIDADWLTLDDVRGRSLMVHDGLGTKSGGAAKFACGVIG